MNIRKVKYFYKEGDHQCEVVSKAIETVGMENPQEYNTHDFQHIEEDLMPFFCEQYPHDRVPCMFYKKDKIFEASEDMTDDDLVNAVRDIYEKIKDLPY